MKNRFTLHNVTKQFVGAPSGVLPLHVLNDISVQFEEGERYAIAGISGTGKSTFLSLLAGIDEVTTGSVLYNTYEVYPLAKESPLSFYTKHVSMIFQVPYLINELSVLENIMLRGMITGQSPTESRKRAFELLEKVDLADKALLAPATLSLGQAQRVAVLRALFSKPSFVIADEPTAHLDGQTREMVLSLLDDFHQSGGGLIMTSHDPSVIKRMHKIYDLVEGNLVPRLRRT